MPIILNVNDREITRYVIGKTLTGAGFEVLDATTGEDALQLIHSTPVELVVLDIQMPGMNGFEVCRRLKQDASTAAIPVLISSATFTSSDNRVQGLDAGADAYLVQPFESHELIATVKALLRIRKAEHDAQAALRLRDDFLAIASHELKTPLTAMGLRLQSYSRKFSRASSDSLPRDQVMNFVDRAQRDWRTLHGLVEKLLDVSRIAEGKLPLEVSDVDLSAVARNVVERFAEAAKAVACDLSLELDPELWGSWDRVRVDQIVANLVSNAIKYGPGAPIQVRTFREDGRAVVEVQDRGIGIPPEAQERIFKRFERAAPTTHQTGLGLGLYIVRQILSTMGGSIHLKSAPGEGSVFRVELPLEASRAITG